MDKKILVVDDAMFMRSIIRKILKEDGYTQVWEARDGEKAMELFREVSPAQGTGQAKRGCLPVRTRSMPPGKSGS